jgi:hypothetical protein
MGGVDSHALVVPLVAQGGDKGDVPTSAAQVVGDKAQLGEQLLAGVEGEPFGLLVVIGHVVLGVGHHRDGEACVLRRLGRVPSCGHRNTSATVAMAELFTGAEPISPEACRQTGRVGLNPAVSLQSFAVVGEWGGLRSRHEPSSYPARGRVLWAAVGCRKQRNVPSLHAPVLPHHQGERDAQEG